MTTTNEDPVAAAQAALDAARAVLADLEAKQITMCDDITAIVAKKEKIALDALSTGGAARKKLDEHNAKIAELEREQKDLVAALAGGRQRVANCEAALKRAQEIAEASRWPSLADELDAVGAEAIAAFAEFKTKIGRAKDIVAELRLRGAIGTTPMQAIVNLRNAIQVSLMDIGIDANTIPVSQRHGLPEVLENWSRWARASAERVLGSDAKKRAA